MANPRKPRRPMTTEERLRNGGRQRVCRTCGADFWTMQSQLDRYPNGGRYCSRPCKYEARRGRPSSGGKVRGPELILRSDGYVALWKPDHPKAHDGRVLQHVVVAEQKIGRSLVKGETVHHINHDRADNRPENLEVLTNAEHARMHANDPARAAARVVAAYRRERDPETGRFM